MNLVTITQIQGIYVDSRYSRESSRESAILKSIALTLIQILIAHILIPTIPTQHLIEMVS